MPHSFNFISDIQQVIDDLSLLVAEMAKSEVDSAIVTDCLKQAYHKLAELSCDKSQRADRGLKATR
jgi:hypothetical protein